VPFYERVASVWDCEVGEGTCGASDYKYGQFGVDVAAVGILRSVMGDVLAGVKPEGSERRRERRAQR